MGAEYKYINVLKFKPHQKTTSNDAEIQLNSKMQPAKTTPKDRLNLMAIGIASSGSSRKRFGGLAPRHL